MTAFDTNILLYCCDKRDAARQQTALALMESRTDGVILWQVACEFVAASRKLEGQGFRPEDA
jgi:predicted nucleic acid-binding protein